MPMENRRSSKYVKPRLQSRGILVGALVASIVLVVQAVTITYLIHRVADQMPRDGARLAQALPGLVLQSLAISAVFLIPVLILIGLNVTHRVAGPLHRVERHLEDLAGGEDPGPLVCRRTDEIPELSELVNRVRERMVAQREPVLDRRESA